MLNTSLQALASTFQQKKKKKKEKKKSKNNKVLFYPHALMEISNAQAHSQAVSYGPASLPPNK